MANSTKKGRNVTSFPTVDPPFDASDPSTAVAAEPETPFDPPIAPQAPPRKTPKTLTFFQRVASIDRADWGERAKIKVYRLAPLINRLAGSEHKFITIYADPVTEERLKIDHGSGRYRLYLNYKNAGTKDEKELDMVELDILDPSFPPKIPPGEWLDDPRNKQWAWARPAGAGQPQPGQQQPAAPTGLDTLVGVMQATNEMRRDLREEMQAGVPAPESQQNPIAVGLSIAKEFMQMRSENPMVDVLKAQLESAARSQEAERDRAFKAQEAAREREFKLQQELLAARSAPATAAVAAPPKTFLEQLTEFKAIKELLGVSTAAAEVVHSGRTTALDLVKEIASKVVDSDIGTGLGQYLGSLAQKNMQGINTPQMNPAQNGQVQTAPAMSFRQFLEQVVNPALLRHYGSGGDGASFAAWLYDGYPDRLQELQNVQGGGMKGPAAIIAGYRMSPHMWPALIAQGENAFHQFVQEFCAWKPEEEAGEDANTIEAEMEDLPSGPIDLDDPQDGRPS